MLCERYQTPICPVNMKNNLVLHAMHGVSSLASSAPLTGMPGVVLQTHKNSFVCETWDICYVCNQHEKYRIEGSSQKMYYGAYRCITFLEYHELVTRNKSIAMLSSELLLGLKLTHQSSSLGWPSNAINQKKPLHLLEFQIENDSGYQLRYWE